MKHIFLPLIAVALSFAALSQSNSKSHYLKTPTVVTPVDITQLYTKPGFIKGNAESLDTVKTINEIMIQEVDATPVSKKVVIIDTIFKTPIIIEQGFAYNILQEIGSFTIIKFWPIKDNKGVGLISAVSSGDRAEAPALTTNFGSLQQLKVEGLKVKNQQGSLIFDLSKNYYLVKTADLKNNSVEFENKKGLWNIGLLVLPVKLRPFATEKGQFDFADGFSVGTTFSWTVHHNWKTNFSHSFLLFVGISSYTADSSKLREQRNDYKIAAFSPAIGWMWEKNNIQLSLLTGIDFPTGNLQQKWVYRNKPWVGVGVGIGLFKIGNENNTAKQSN